MDAGRLATMKHMERVRNLLNVCVVELLDRGRLHDQSKLLSPEAEAFEQYTSKLAGSTFGSAEYDANKAAMDTALQHHYANNRHHPEHFPDGINDMTLVDLMEMFVDWKAASERHNNGNILKSIEHNAKRFGIASQLEQIFANTAAWMEGR